jgi:thiosulfate dehydrogenase
MLDEKNAEQLVYGARLNIETRDLLPKNVGNALNCASCHLNAGTVADGSPYIGVSAFFPSYAPRAGRVITLEDRINGCFLRSMNGKPLPLDSDEMKAMVAYFDWMRNETKPEDKVEGRGVGKISQRSCRTWKTARRSTPSSARSATARRRRHQERQGPVGLSAAVGR